MTAESGSGSGADARERRDELIRTYVEGKAELVAAARRPEGLPLPERKKRTRELEEVLAAYFEALPRLALSRCPHCEKALYRAFDPWGLDGFWWQEELAAEIREEPACPHFQLLTGAVAFQGLPAKGGEKAAYPGPEVPYVVPRVLELSTMVAVVSCLRVEPGYRAYPVAYFAQTAPPPGSLTQSWTRRSYSFRNEAGAPSFTYDASPWDFDLVPWVDRTKVRWVAPDDRNLTLRLDPREYPYTSLPGARQPLEVKGTSVRKLALPDGSKVDPFSE